MIFRRSPAIPRDRSLQQNPSYDEGRFDGPRVDCEQVPLLPARAVARALDDPRKIPYLFVWKRPEDSSEREAVRVSAWSELVGWAEIKRPDGSRDLIRSLLQPLPRNGGKARLLICPYCKIPRRGLNGWELGGQYSLSSTRSSWGCRRCNLLRYASEGGTLLVRPRGTLGHVFGSVHSPRPEPWLGVATVSWVTRASKLFRVRWKYSARSRRSPATRKSTYATSSSVRDRNWPTSRSRFRDAGGDETQ
jgi:hypothetical protein